MRELSKKLNEIVNKFMQENVAKETKHDLIIAAIHFNINFNVCTKYDLMRIDHKAKELANVEEKKMLTTASIYSYILFRAINRNEIPKEYLLNIKTALIQISIAITDYMTYRVDESILNNNLFSILNPLIEYPNSIWYFNTLGT